MKTNKTTKTAARCCGTKKTADGTFHCDERPIAAYSWDGVPFLYKGKPGAAACSGHAVALYDATSYPNLKLIEVLKKPKTIEDLKNDPRVTDFSDERGNHDGVWAYLVAGFCSDGATHQVAEDTVASALEAMSSVKPCACDDCEQEKATGDGLPAFVKKARKLQAVS